MTDFEFYPRATLDAQAREIAELRSQRDEALGLLWNDLRDYIVAARDAELMPHRKASYQRELDELDALLARIGDTE